MQWLRDRLGIIATADESHELAASCADTGGVVRAAPLGLGTPRGTTAARAVRPGARTGRAEIALLEGVAQRGADLVDAAVADSGIEIPVVRVDGGMTDNPTFIQALADATGRPVEISPVREATARGAALLAALALGHYDGIDDLAATWVPRADRADRNTRPGAVARARARPGVDPGALRDRLLGVGVPSVGKRRGEQPGGRRPAARERDDAGGTRPGVTSATTPSTASATRFHADPLASIVPSFKVVIAPTPSTTSRMPTSRTIAQRRPGLRATEQQAGHDSGHCEHHEPVDGARAPVSARSAAGRGPRRT